MAFVPSQLRRAIIASALVPVVAFAQALPAAASLMAKHNAAVGGRAALDQHTSLRMTATMSIAAMGMEASLEVFRAKPNRFVQKTVLGAMGEATQGFDGKVAWMLNPMLGAQLLEGDAAEGIRNQADFFSTFQDSANYPGAETVELSDFEGRKCYKVRVVRNKMQGFEYFDATTGLLAGISGTTATPQGNVESTTIIAEWAEYGGVKFPKRMEQRSVAGTATITWTAVEFDKVDPAVFDLPPAVKALVKP